MRTESRWSWRLYLDLCFFKWDLWTASTSQVVGSRSRGWVKIEFLDPNPHPLHLVSGKEKKENLFYHVPPADSYAQQSLRTIVLGNCKSTAARLNLQVMKLISLPLYYDLKDRVKAVVLSQEWFFPGTLAGDIFWFVAGGAMLLVGIS